MHYSLDMRAHNTVSNSATLLQWDKADTDIATPDVGLRVVRRGERHLDFSLFGSRVQNVDGLLTGSSERPANEVFARCDDCRTAWMRAVVEATSRVPDPETLKEKFSHPFQDAWDHARNPQSLIEAAPILALAGDRLFNAIFESKADTGLKGIASRLRTVLAEGSCHVAITSSDLFVPWGMLYTHPVPGERLAADGANWRKEGFWGYRHLVHQNTERLAADAARLDPAASALLSVNFDDRLATDLKLPVIDTHISSIAALVAEPRIRRTRKAELALGFTSGRETLERILYFYCHGRGAGADSTRPAEPHLILSDGEVKAADFEYWSDGDKPLPTNPLIFINACQGGQMQTLFYQSFAVTLLKQGATGLIGAQVDVPAVFAAAYAERVFRAFFEKSERPVRMGPLLLQVNRALWDDHHNPLGLVYSLYRGVNCFIDWRGKAA
ncbi:MAG: hypothetical protein ACOY4R_12025 [Pseudomonadota bacterium]